MSDLRVNRSCDVTVRLIISCNYLFSVQCGYIFICSVSDRVRFLFFIFGYLNIYLFGFVDSII